MGVKHGLIIIALTGFGPSCRPSSWRSQVFSACVAVRQFMSEILHI